MSDSSYEDYLDDDYFEDDDDHQEDQTARGLRKTIEKQNRKIKSLESENTKYRKTENERQAKEALSGKGFKNTRKVARDLLADGIDLSDSEAVNEWLSENGDDYARDENSETETPSAEENEIENSEEHSEMASAFERLNNTQRMATPAHLSKYEAATAQLSDDASPDEVERVFREAGI